MYSISIVTAPRFSPVSTVPFVLEKERSKGQLLQSIQNIICTYHFYYIRLHFRLRMDAHGWKRHNDVVPNAVFHVCVYADTRLVHHGDFFGDSQA